MSAKVTFFPGYKKKNNNPKANNTRIVSIRPVVHSLWILVNLCKFQFSTLQH